MKKPSLAQRVQARRIEQGFDTQIEAAHAAGVGTTTWSLLESQGQVPKTPRPQRRIEQLLGWPEGSLRDGGLPASNAPEAPSGDTLEELLSALEKQMALVALILEQLINERRQS